MKVTKIYIIKDLHWFRNVLHLTLVYKRMRLNSHILVSRC